MARFLSSLSQDTFAALSNFKERANITRREVKDEYIDAINIFESINNDIIAFTNLMNNIIKCASDVYATGNEIAELTTPLQDLDSSTHIRAIVNPLYTFLTANSKINQKYFSELIQNNIMTKFNPSNDMIEYVKNLRDKIDKHHYKLVAVKDSLKAAKKLNATELSNKLLFQCQDLKDKIDNETAVFIITTNKLQELKNGLIENAMREFIGITNTFAQFIYGNIMTMANEQLSEDKEAFRNYGEMEQPQYPDN